MQFPSQYYSWETTSSDISWGNIGMTVLVRKFLGENRRPIHAGVGNITEKKKKTFHVQVSIKDSPRVTPLPPFKMTIYRKE